MRDTQIYNEVEPLRQSHISINSQFNESMLVNAVADVLLNEISSQTKNYEPSPRIDSEVSKRLGEEMIISKIHNIFDEI